MKRILALVLYAFIWVACTSPADRAEDLFDDIIEAMEEKDFDKYLDILIEYKKWYDSASMSEQQEFDEAWREIDMEDKDEMIKLEHGFFPKWLNSGQFEKWCLWDECYVTIGKDRDYYYGSCNYKDQNAYIICFDNKYYISLNDPSDFPAVIVPFEEADKAIKWLDGVYSRFTSIRGKVKNKHVTIANPDMCYVVGEDYKSGEYKWLIYDDLYIWESKISCELDGELEIHFSPCGSLTITDASYHAMKGALKSRNILKESMEKNYDEAEKRYADYSTVAPCEDSEVMYPVIYEEDI